MKFLRHSILVLSACLIVSGCASVPEIPREPFEAQSPDKARIYLSRVEFSLKHATPTIGNEALRELFLPAGGKWLSEVSVAAIEETENLNFVSLLSIRDQYDYIDVAPGEITLRFIAGSRTYGIIWNSTTTWNGQVEAGKSYHLITGHAGMSWSKNTTLLRTLEVGLPDEISQSCAESRDLGSSTKEIIKTLSDEGKVDLLALAACNAMAKALPPRTLHEKAAKFWNNDNQKIHDKPSKPSIDNIADE